MTDFRTLIDLVTLANAGTLCEAARSPAVKTLYHATSRDRLASIQKFGLDPSYSREPSFRKRSIYLSADLGHAFGYENHHGDWLGGAVAFSVQVRDLDAAALGPDDVDLPDILDQMGSRRDWTEISWRQSLKLSGQCTYSKLIPATAMLVSVDQGATWVSLSSWGDE